MDNKSLMSIIIPVRNSEKTIKKCVNSILNQQGVNIEILLINDHSTDLTPVICQELATKYPSIKFYNSIESGVSAARNLGVDNAEGSIIGFCDSDDYGEPDVLQKIAEIFLNDEKIDIIITGFNFRNIYEKTIEKYEKGTVRYGLWNSEDIMCKILTDNSIMGSVWNKFFRREVIGDTRFNISLSYCEDMYFVFDILCKQNYNIYISPIITYNYVISNNSVSRDWNSIFDESGDNKYSQTMSKMVNELHITNKIKHYLIHDRLKFSLSFFLNDDIRFNDKQLKYVNKYLKQDFIPFITLVYLNPRTDLSLLIKSIIKISLKRLSKSI